MQNAETVLGVLRDHWRARCPETGTPGSEGDRTEKDPLKGRHLAVRSTLPCPTAR